MTNPDISRPLEHVLPQPKEDEMSNPLRRETVAFEGHGGS
jgi:hypothetical protein